MRIREKADILKLKRLGIPGGALLFQMEMAGNTTALQT